MIAVTELAKEKLKQALQKQTSDPDVALRITSNYQVAHRLELILDKEKCGDKVVHSTEGGKVLLVRPDVASGLQGVVLNYGKTFYGTDFILEKHSESKKSNLK
jgi:Fe-S cluster assembly iron-binding protein IscA